jgi:hypothetical protein
MALTKIQSLGITDGTIVNADINASAAIAGTKLTGVGKVLQVVTATDSTQRSTTSTSFVTASNTLSVSITPSSASNKVFIFVSSNCGNSNSYDIYATIYRGATDLGAASSKGLTFMSGGGTSAIAVPLVIGYLDSPSDTSSLTYQLYYRVNSGTGLLNVDNSKTSITVFEIAG